jgi:hypothetical protein
MTARYVVQPVPQGSGWLMVADLLADRPEVSPAAMFRPDYRAEAQEFADRLNVRALAGRD